MTPREYARLRDALTDDVRTIVREFAAGGDNQAVYALVLLYSHLGRVDVALNTEAGLREALGDAAAEVEDDPEADRFEAAEFVHQREGGALLTKATRDLLDAHAEALGRSRAGDRAGGEQDTYPWCSAQLRDAVLAAARRLAKDPALEALDRTPRFVVYVVEREQGVDADLMRKVIPVKRWRQLFPDFG